MGRRSATGRDPRSMRDRPQALLGDRLVRARLAGIALLFVGPLSGVYAAFRLVLPIGPGWVLSSIGLLSLFTAIYAAGMATIQRETRRFFAHCSSVTLRSCWSGWNYKPSYR